jgi:hypothetical protein
MSTPDLPAHGALSYNCNITVIARCLGRALGTFDGNAERRRSARRHHEAGTLKTLKELENKP